MSDQPEPPERDDVPLPRVRRFEVTRGADGAVTRVNVHVRGFIPGDVDDTDLLIRYHVTDGMPEFWTVEYPEHVDGNYRFSYEHVPFVRVADRAVLSLDFLTSGKTLDYYVEQADDRIEEEMV